jgi:hypothetical protein
MQLHFGEFFRSRKILVFAMSGDKVFWHLIMCREAMYLSPEVEIFEILAEGILCSSNEYVGEEDGNGGFA